MLIYAAALAATETAVAQPVAGSSTQRDCASFVLCPDGRISSWNQPAEQMLGYSGEQALGRHFAWFFPVDEVQRGGSERVLRIAGENGFISGKAPGCGKTIHCFGHGWGYWRCAIPLESYSGTR